MSRPEPAGEPSMEEILASIRRIIAEEPNGAKAAPALAATASAGVLPPNPLLNGRAGPHGSAKDDLPLPAFGRLAEALGGPAAEAAAMPGPNVLFEDDLSDLLIALPETRKVGSSEPRDANSAPAQMPLAPTAAQAPKSPAPQTNGVSVATKAAEPAPAPAMARPGGKGFYPPQNAATVSPAAATAVAPAGSGAAPATSRQAEIDAAAAAARLRIERNLPPLVKPAAPDSPSMPALNGSALNSSALNGSALNGGHAPAAAAPVTAREPNLAAPAKTAPAAETRMNGMAPAAPAPADAKAAAPEQVLPRVQVAAPILNPPPAAPLPAAMAVPLPPRSVSMTAAPPQPTAAARSEPAKPAVTAPAAPVRDSETSAAGASALGALAAGLAASSAASAPVTAATTAPSTYAAQSVQAPRPPAGAAPAAPPVRTLEDAIADMMRPMLQQWITDNMPRIIEKALRVETAKSIKDMPKQPGA